MNKVFTSLIAIPLIFGVVGCTTWANQLVTPVPAVVDSAIQNSFMTLNIGLTALAFIPGLPAIVVQEAKATNIALQAAYAQYKSDPTATNSVALMQSAIQAAQTFMANQAKAAMVNKGLIAP